jgi:hypothetical protein
LRTFQKHWQTCHLATGCCLIDEAGQKTESDTRGLGLGAWVGFHLCNAGENLQLLGSSR